MRSEGGEDGDGGFIRWRLGGAGLRGSLTFLLTESVHSCGALIGEKVFIKLECYSSV